MIRASEIVKPDDQGERNHKTRWSELSLARQNTSEIDFLTVSLAKTGNSRSPVNDERIIKPDFSYLVVRLFFEFVWGKKIL